jgi:hypothetical protein
MSNAGADEPQFIAGDMLCRLARATFGFDFVVGGFREVLFCSCVAGGWNICEGESAR